MPIRFSFDREPPDATLRIAGELDLAVWDQLRTQLGHLRDSVDGAIHIDLADVTFVDCTCLRVFEELRLDMVASGRSLRLRSAQPCFLRICALAGYGELSQLAARMLVVVRSGRPVPQEGI